MNKANFVIREEINFIKVVNFLIIKQDKIQKG